ncbi:uncharacterized protein BO66DRAFT_50791 [Aspergillus aculeatinus CBS 121060]|uniref:Uncharacterized protein n=1 Tax=Aspergillus aculeatinus CBS 121060 TaxID=1448322 RepID=A0ACD1HCW0_9EURO|nr:hypothetical protein BO66DRAFT_50791 [Aspergillus aculeatinus CBS 121060]RAH71495.1 hypothetical protein BO66DRAFT_50791 [Aspergillus aculeatinus CBS 121060]
MPLSPLVIRRGAGGGNRLKRTKKKGSGWSIRGQSHLQNALLAAIRLASQLLLGICQLSHVLCIGRLIEITVVSHSLDCGRHSRSQIPWTFQFALLISLLP